MLKKLYWTNWFCIFWQKKKQIKKPPKNLLSTIIGLFYCNTPIKIAKVGNRFVVCATLPGVETLKYPPFHGIWVLSRWLVFSKLVSDIFSKWNSSKHGF